MAYGSLADFLEELDSRGELARVAAEVDGELEIAEITRRVASHGGPALLFEHVRGSPMAVVTNLLGTEARVCRALQIETLDEILARTESLIARHTPQNWFERLKTSDDESGAAKFRPKPAKAGACQQVVRLGRDVDLAVLPLVRHGPGETGRSITAGRIISRDRSGQVSSVALCPLVALDANRLAIVDPGGSPLARHLAEFRAADEKMPLAIILGGDPAGMIAGSLEVPDGTDPLHVTGLLRGQAVEVVKCRTHAIEVPADADLVIEGYVDPAEPGVPLTSVVPGGSHYRALQDAPAIHVTAVTHRGHPIVPSIVDSGTRSELASLGKVRERMLLPTLRAVAAEIVDVHLPSLGGRDRFALVSIRKSLPYHARQVASALWGSPSLRFTRFLIIVDEQVDPRDGQRVLSEIGANVMPERDVFTYDGPASTAEPEGIQGALMRHLGVDATAKIVGERTPSSLTPLTASEEAAQLVDSRWVEYKLDLPGSGR